MLQNNLYFVIISHFCLEVKGWYESKNYILFIIVSMSLKIVEQQWNG